MINMLDDHDLIDGFGSYEDATQQSPIFSHIGSRGYFWFLLFQLFTVDNVDGVSQEPGNHPLRNMVKCGKGAWIPHPNHSLLSYLGPKVYILLLDCRAERSLAQICSDFTYNKVFGLLEQLPEEVDQLIIQIGECP